METMIVEEPKTNIRDYSLVGKESESSIKKGLANAQWYTTPIPRDSMNALLVRKNGPAIRDTFIWFSLLFGSGYLVYFFWGSWIAAIPYIVYSVIYASTSDSRWHESSHGTAFKSDWMNNVLYEIASFMVVRQSTVWRYSHARHHSDTIIRGRDPEIAVARPADILKVLLIFVGISSSVPEFKKIFQHASGKIGNEVASYLPKYEYGKVIRIARIYLLIYASVITLCIAGGTILPAMYIGLPTLLGSWLMPVYGLTQHAGLAENVLDHRLNCRTVYMNPIHRFLYWNMNYHIEHHMFPLVPYHALPKLHELMKHDCPRPYGSIWQTYKEIIPAIIKQAKDPSYYVKRELPVNISSQVINQEINNTLIPEEVSKNIIKICANDDIANGEIKRFEYNQHSFAIYKTIKGDVCITDGYCTHGNAHLADGMLIDNLIECAKHNGRFNIHDGSPQRPPVCEKLHTYKTDVKDGYIYMKYKFENINEQDQNRVFTVVSNHNVTPWIKELVLNPEDNKPVKYKPGQYIKLEIPAIELTQSDFNIDETFMENWKNITCFTENHIVQLRNYSMASNPSINTELILNVRIAMPPDDKKNMAGIGSSYVFSLKKDDRVIVKGIHGDFLIKETVNEMVYIGGGAGMAPIKSHISQLLETKNNKRIIHFYYGARTSKDIFYQEYFTSLEKKYKNFSFHLALSEKTKKDAWNGHSGNIHDIVYNDYLKNHPQINTVEFYLCGPPVMIEATHKMLKELGVKEEMIAFDAF